MSSVLHTPGNTADVYCVTNPKCPIANAIVLYTPVTISDVYYVTYPWGGGIWLAPAGQVPHAGATWPI